MYDIVTTAILCKKNKLEKLTFLFTICNGCISREDKTYRVTLIEYESQVSKGRFLGPKMDLFWNYSSKWHYSACWEEDVDETLLECNFQVSECECKKTLLNILGNPCDPGKNES